MDPSEGPHPRQNYHHVRPQLCHVHHLTLPNGDPVARTPNHQGIPQPNVPGEFQTSSHNSAQANLS